MSSSFPKRRHSIQYMLNEAVDLDIESTASSSQETTKPLDPEPPAGAAEHSDFAFVNISNPSQPADAERRRFVRQYARTSKLTREANDTQSPLRGPLPLAPVELAPGMNPFINISHPSQGRDAGTRTFIKQQSHRRHRKERPRNTADNLVETQRKPTDCADQVSSEDVMEDAGGVVSLDASRNMVLGNRSKNTSHINSGDTLDNFIKEYSHMSRLFDDASTVYPIQMDSFSYRVVEFLHDISFTKLLPGVGPPWFSLFIKDEAAFHELLGGTSIYMDSICGTNNERKLIEHKSKALRLVHTRLSDPEQQLSIGIVISIVLFLLNDIVIQDRKRYQINRAGLRQIIELRGGIETLDHLFKERSLVLWAEVHGAYAFDDKPEYFIPANMFPTEEKISPIPFSPRFLSLVEKWNQFHSDRTEVIATFHDLYVVSSNIKLGLPELQVYPTIMRMMACKNSSVIGICGGCVEQALRLASLLYLGSIRSAFGESFVQAAPPPFIERLKNAISTESNEWDNFEDLRLWAVVQGGISTTGPDQLVWAEMARKTMMALGAADWSDTMLVVKDFMWNDNIHEEKGKSFGIEVMKGWT